MIDRYNIDSFLKLGYFLDYKNPSYSLDLSKVNKEKYKEATLKELIEEGTRLFKQTIERLFVENQRHVVPISGGLDSRVILAALLEFTDAANIKTYTFGTPGSLDYDIGNQIALVAGTDHVNFPLTEYEYNMDELLDISKRVDYQTVLFHHPPVWKIDELFGDDLIWSGFFAGSLVGQQYIEKSPTEINEAINVFLGLNIFQHEINLIKKTKCSLSSMVDLPEGSYDHINILEQLNFYNRQFKFIAPHVLMTGYNYRVPFLDQDLVNFFVSVEETNRKNQSLYKKMLLEKYPFFFSFPIKDNLGMPMDAPRALVLLNRFKNKVSRTITGNNKYINYLDFDIKIREKQDLREIVKKNIHDLYNRKIIDWLDIREIYIKHIDKKNNYGKALILLTSLEIHMKSMEINKI